MTATIVCVLKTGGDFRAEHAERLRRQVGDKWAFVCLTDDPALMWRSWTRPLRNDWPGWWSKLEAFQTIRGPVLYLDLDVNVVGDLQPLVDALPAADPLIVSDDFGGRHDINTSVMGWQESPAHLLRRFEPTRDISLFSTAERWGDQGWLASVTERLPTWQDVVGPSAVKSFKLQVQKGNTWLGDTAVVVSHGEPRPWDPGGADSWLPASSREDVAA